MLLKNISRNPANFEFFQLYCRFCNLELQNVEHRFKHFEKGNLCLVNNNNLANIVDSQPAAEYDDENNLLKPKQLQERIGKESKVATETKGLPFVIQPSTVNITMCLYSVLVSLARS